MGPDHDHWGSLYLVITKRMNGVEGLNGNCKDWFLAWTQNRNGLRQKAQIINLKGVEEKASLNLGKRYWKIVLNGKSCACTYTKSILGHALVIWSKVLNFSFLLLYFFNLLLSLSFFFLVFFLCVFLLIPFRVIYHDFSTNFSAHVWVRCSEFLCPLSPLLEPSTLSCKAAVSLLKHHLHINAARELAGQHLMRR